MQKYFLVLHSLLLLPSFSDAHFLVSRPAAPAASPEETLINLFSAQRVVSITQLSNQTLAGDRLTKGLLIRFFENKNEVAIITPKRTTKFIEINSETVEAILRMVKKRIKVRYVGGPHKGTEEYEVLEVGKLEVGPAKLKWRWTIEKEKETYRQQLESFWLGDKTVQECICESLESRKRLALEMQKQGTLTYYEALVFINQVYEKVKPKKHWFDAHIEEAVRNSEADSNALLAQADDAIVANLLLDLDMLH